MTYEKSRSTWNNGFRGYKDNSPEAKHGRLQYEADQTMVMLWTKGNIQVLTGSPAEKFLSSQSKYVKRVK